MRLLGRQRQLDPMQARLDELLRRLESQELSGLFKQHKFLSTHKNLLGGQLKQQNHSNNLTMRGGMGMISGLVKAGTTGRMRLGAIPSQRTIPRTVPTWNGGFTEGLEDWTIFPRWLSYPHVVLCT